MTRAANEAYKLSSPRRRGPSNHRPCPTLHRHRLLGARLRGHDGQWLGSGSANEGRTRSCHSCRSPRVRPSAGPRTASAESRNLRERFTVHRLGCVFLLTRHMLTRARRPPAKIPVLSPDPKPGEPHRAHRQAGTGEECHRPCRGRPHRDPRPRPRARPHGPAHLHRVLLPPRHRPRADTGTDATSSTSCSSPSPSTG